MKIPLAGLDGETVRRFDRKGPRYTSYPTADRFVATFGPEAYRRAAAGRNAGGRHRPLSLYVHLPFCRDICFYCACNKIVTRDRGKAARYLDCLAREIALQGDLFRDDPRACRMHWGGGTPTYHDLTELRALWREIAARFDLSPQGEYAIEVDPRTVDAGAVAGLREIGFNRVSFGVQDFDPRVQEAVHRLQSEELTLNAMRAARDAGFDSVNVDLIYGLPKQTDTSFDSTLTSVIAACPDRIALYNYAHLPAQVKSQRRILQADLPSPESRVGFLAVATARLSDAGYVSIGMDHFALPGDALAVAQRQGRLRRDFQGYSAGEECDLVGLGVSAVGAVGPTYSQNHRVLKDYYDRLDSGEVPIMRGLELNADDLVRRAVIQALICNFSLSKQSIEITYLIDFDRYFAAELDELADYEKMRLVDTEDAWITITDRGRPVIRAICMVFDRYLRGDTSTGHYSRVV